MLEKIVCALNLVMLNLRITLQYNSHIVPLIHRFSGKHLSSPHITMSAPFFIRKAILGVCLLPLWLGAQHDTTRYLAPVHISDSLRQLQQIEPLRTTFRRDSAGRFAVGGLGADAVLAQAAGVQIRSYGGHGGVKTLSLRGFAANQTAVSINGVPYQQTQTGVVNFGEFRADAFDEISVSQQPNVAQNPMAGEVQFHAAPTANAARVGASLGSFGEKNMQGYGAYIGKKIRYSASANALAAQDNYPFSLNGITGRRENAQFSQLQMQIFGQRDFVGKHRAGWIEGFSTATFSRQGVPSAVVQGNPQGNRDALAQQNSFSYLKGNVYFSKKQAQSHFLTFTTSLHRHTMRYATAPMVAEYHGQDMYQAFLYQYIKNKLIVKINAEYQHNALRGNNLAIRFVPIAQIVRQQYHAGALCEYSHQRHRLTAQVRVNRLLAYGFLPNGAAVWRFQVNEHSDLTTNLTYSHRIPSFNELYYFGYGNASLLPEKTRSALVALTASPRIFGSRCVKVSGQVFGNITQNKIISIPINPAQWSTFSIGRAETVGAIFSAEVVLRRHLLGYATYTLQRAIDRTRTPATFLPYTPSVVFTGGFRADWRSFRGFVNGTYSHCRYALLSNTPRSFLPAYAVVEAGIAYSQKLGKHWLDYTFSAENLTNTSYEVIRSYPMPPRSVRGGVQVRF